VKLAKARGVPVVLVINYESAWRSPFAEWILRQRVDFMVADEIHRCKAPGGKASRFLARFGKVARYRLGMTGTPMPHGPEDLYGELRAIAPSVFGWSNAAFRQRYMVMGGFQNHQIVGYRNLEELNRKFYSVAFRVTKDVLDLPPEMHVTYTCELGPEAWGAYQSLKRDLIARLESGEVTAANAMVRLLRFQQITGGYIRTDEGEYVQIDSAKMNLLRDVLEDIDPAEPVVIFCRFHKDLDAINRVADETGRRALELSGRVDDLKRWQAGEAPVLAVQIESGGVGVDLTRARYAIYYSLGFSLGSYEQSLARIHRPGQTRPAEYIHLLAKNTVDEKVMAALAAKADVVTTVLQQLKGDAMNTEELKRFVALEERRRQLEAEVDTLKAEAAELEQRLLPQFEQEGFEKITVDGRTVYVERRLWAKAKDGDKAAVCKALKRARLGDYVEETFNTNSLSAYVRELDREDRALPPSLREVLEVSEVFKLRTRRS